MAKSNFYFPLFLIFNYLLFFHLSPKFLYLALTLTLVDEEGWLQIHFTSPLGHAMTNRLNHVFSG